MAPINIASSGMTKAEFIAWANQPVQIVDRAGAVDCLTLWKYAAESGLYQQVKALLSSPVPQIAQAAEYFIAYVTPTNPARLVYTDSTAIVIMQALAAGGVDVAAHQAAALLYENTQPRYAAWGYTQFGEAEYDAALAQIAREQQIAQLNTLATAAESLITLMSAVPDVVAHWTATPPSAQSLRAAIASYRGQIAAGQAVTLPGSLVALVQQLEGAAHG